MWLHYKNNFNCPKKLGHILIMAGALVEGWGKQLMRRRIVVRADGPVGRPEPRAAAATTHQVPPPVSPLRCALPIHLLFPHNIWILEKSVTTSSFFNTCNIYLEFYCHALDGSFLFQFWGNNQYHDWGQNTMYIYIRSYIYRHRYNYELSHEMNVNMFWCFYNFI